VAHAMFGHVSHRVVHNATSRRINASALVMKSTREAASDEGQSESFEWDEMCVTDMQVVSNSFWVLDRRGSGTQRGF